MFNMSLGEFIREKIERENLYNYEIARILNVSNVIIGKLRKDYGIKRVNHFVRRFEEDYGHGSVATFKQIIEKPHSTLTDVAGYFGFSRENARLVYKKIYGFPYTETYKRKLEIKKRLRKESRPQKSTRSKGKRLSCEISSMEKAEPSEVYLHNPSQ
jgi:hypothetical protein